jgi:putative ABC transport system ATP-binding protein
LLLDEPTAALDAEATAMAERLVGNWLDEKPAGRASIWVTHDRDQARRISTRVLAIHDGRLAGDANGRIR